ncbi:MAG: hypothetical protein ACHQ1H_01740 [Nitrososphaerales archaeon]
MSGNMRSVTVVITGILLASSIIVGITLLQREGILPEISSTGKSSSHTLITSTSNAVSIIVTTPARSPSSSVTQTTSSTTPQSSASNFVLQIHDPPHVPPGVSSVYVSYADILLRSSNGSWYDLKVNGSIDLMSVVNFTETIANFVLNGGKYDQLQMNLSSVVVTSNSKNYSATISNNQLVIPIIGGVAVSSSFESGALIDVSPAVIQHTFQNSTGGIVNSFVLVPSANAYVIPRNQLNPTTAFVGDREDIRTQSWLVSEENQKSNQTSFQLSSITLSSSFIKVTIKNTGNSSVLLQTAFLESNATQYSTSEDDSGRYNVGGAVLFGILGNGSLVPFSDGETGDTEGTNSYGYNLPASSQVTLTYVGPISSSTATSETVQSSTEDNGATTITGSTITTATQSASGSDENIIVPMASVAIVTTSTSYNYGIIFQVTPGTPYTVGVTSGSLTVTSNIIAS